MKETTKKRMIISAVIAAIVVVAAVTTILIIVFSPITEDKCLQIISKDISEDMQEKGWHSWQKKIEIFDEDQLVATYQQTYYIKNDADGSVALLYMDEKYYTLGTDSEDKSDEYYYNNRNIYVRRTQKSEDIRSDYEAEFSVFLEIIDEKVGTLKYDFSKANLENINIIKGKTNVFSATVIEDSKKTFFASSDTDHISDISVEGNILGKKQLQSLSISYKDSGDAELGEVKVVITLEKKEETDIIKPTWV